MMGWENGVWQNEEMEGSASMARNTFDFWGLMIPCHRGLLFHAFSLNTSNYILLVVTNVRYSKCVWSLLSVPWRQELHCGVAPLQTENTIAVEESW